MFRVHLVDLLVPATKISVMLEAMEMERELRGNFQIGQLGALLFLWSYLPRELSAGIKRPLLDCHVKSCLDCSYSDRIYSIEYIQLAFALESGR